MDASTVRLAQRVSDAALGWLGRMRPSFALPRDVPDPDIDGGALEALSELGLAAGIVVREAVAGPSGARTAHELLDFAWRECREGDLLYQLQRHAPAAVRPRETYAQFAAAGYRHRSMELLAAHLEELRAARTCEDVPNRRLAALAANRRIGLPDPEDAGRLVEHTWLGATPEPWMLDTGNAHGLTRTVFHLTDYAARPEGLPPRLQDYLHLWLPVWVEVFAESRSWDLLGELLTVDVCLERPHFHARTWECFAEAQYGDGMMPCDVTRLPRPPGPRDARPALLNHRPTVAAVLAGTLTVSRALNAVQARVTRAASAGGPRLPKGPA